MVEGGSRFWCERGADRTSFICHINLKKRITNYSEGLLLKNRIENYRGGPGRNGLRNKMKTHLKISPRNIYNSDLKTQMKTELIRFAGLPADRCIGN